MEVRKNDSVIARSTVLLPEDDWLFYKSEGFTWVERGTIDKHKPRCVEVNPDKTVLCIRAVSSELGENLLFIVPNKSRPMSDSEIQKLAEKAWLLMEAKHGS